MNRTTLLIAAAGVVIACLMAAAPASATLGGDAASIGENHRHLGGDVRVTKLARGERHELRLPTGMVIHEYLSPAGAVYAIAWSGPRAPDLRELLGRYFPQLTRASILPGGGHHRMTLRGDDLAIETMAHRASFVGQAWVPSLVPAGVDVKASLDAAVLR